MMTWRLLSVGVVILPRPSWSRGKLFISCHVTICLMCCSPEVVPSDEEDGAVVPKARSSTKHQKTSVKKESDDEVNL